MKSERKQQPMAWEKIIIEYELVSAYVGDTIPPDWIFLHRMESGRYDDDYFVFKKPIYKKKNINRVDKKTGTK